MKHYTEKVVEKVEREFTSITCDVCGTTYTDTFEIQEFHFVNFLGGYGSVFGDGAHIECDICQHCFIEMIEDYMREIDPPFYLS